jgi:hypothetical protein
MKQTIFLLLAFAFLIACTKKDDDNSNFSPPTLENKFYLEEYDPSIKYSSYDTLLHFSCGPTPVPDIGLKIFPMDFNEDFQVDFFIEITHSITTTSNCPFINYQVSIQGVSNEYQIASENTTAIKFDRDSSIESNNWINEARIYQIDIDSTKNELFTERKFIGLKILKNGIPNYGYVELVFSESDLFISSIGLNLLNSNKIIAGQKQ